MTIQKTDQVNPITYLIHYDDEIRAEANAHNAEYASDPDEIWKEEYIQEMLASRTRKSGIIYQPTGNCQVFSISHIDNLLRFSKTPEILTENLKTIISTIKKPLLLVDLELRAPAKIMKLLEVFPPEYINSKLEYVSSNGSKMVLYILDVKGFMEQGYRDRLSKGYGTLPPMGVPEGSAAEVYQFV